MHEIIIIMNEMLEINIVVFSNTFRFQFTIYRIFINFLEFEIFELLLYN